MAKTDYEREIGDVERNKCNLARLIAELSRAKRALRSTTGKKMWSSTHPRKFGNQVTVHRPLERLSVRTTGLPM